MSFHIHIHTHDATAPGRGRDPTGTTQLRRRYESELGIRFRKVRVALRRAVSEQDVLGRKQEVAGPMFGLSAAERITATSDWLFNMAQREILGVNPGTPSRMGKRSNWQAQYLSAAYDKGRSDADAKIARARRQLHDARRRLPPDERAEIIRQRSFTELEGITDDMSRRISRDMAEGIQQGLSPAQIARGLADEVDISLTRARTMARTEMISAHAEASLNQYEAAGVSGVSVQAEFTTAGDDAVCPQCEALEGNIMTIDEARGLIPVHPNCRCAFLPVVTA